MRNFSSPLMLVAVFLFAFPQEPPTSKQVEVVPGVAISLPARWIIANRATNGLEVAYPLSTREQKARPKETYEPDETQSIVHASMLVVVEPRTTHADAVARLAEIASEEAVRPELLTIADWPAIYRQFSAPLPQPGETESPVDAISTFTTTAIAADSSVLRFETTLAPDADSSFATAALQIAKQVRVRPGNPDRTRRDLETLALLLDKLPFIEKLQPASGKTSGALTRSGPSAPGASEVQKGIGELEVVISADGLHVVVAANSGFSYSDNAGGLFTHGGKTPCIYNRCDGDPSLAIGKSGDVYYSWIGLPTNQKGGVPPNGKTDSLSVSTNNGHSFSFLSNAVVCPTATPTICTTPDQEHIAADRKNSSKLGKDRVYLVWRNFSSLTTSSRIVCSVDGGKTWSAQTMIGAGDYPRITVGGDGFVYTAYHSGSSIMVNKFSNCDSGLMPQPGYLTKVASYTPIPCPVPGLDRCNNGNTLSSQMVAVDDTNPSHLFVSFATNTSAKNDDVMVYDSIDGGASWGIPVQANKSVQGRRFMPWVCASGGVASVSWYDRRAATPAKDDLTAYFRSGAKRVTPPGALQANPEVDVSEVNDPQCASGWPQGERSMQDATSCSQPQLAGQCRLPCASTHPPTCAGAAVGSKKPCDFSSPSCTVPTETCQTWGRGAPKYGDYNGNACTPGINGAEVPVVCTAWSSATPPKGVDTQPGGIQVYASCASTDSTSAPVTITYHQVGACNGFTTTSGLFSAGTNFAYVDFGIESIDNSAGIGKFNFNPSNLYVQQTIRDFVDPGLQFYPSILGTTAAVPTAVPPGDDLKFFISAEAALVVSTTNPNGAVEANRTAYFLLYNRQTGDPPVKLVKSDAKQTSWPLTEDCRAISLH